MFSKGLERNDVKKFLATLKNALKKIILIERSQMQGLGIHLKPQ
jgi:hypothetical protein